MIRILFFLPLLMLWSCSNSSQETPAPPPQPPAAPAAAEAPPAEAPPAEAPPAEAAFKATDPRKPAPAPAPAPSHESPRAADLAMAVTTTDLQLVSKKGLLTKEGVVIQGKVKNNTDKDYHFVEISFKLFDKENKELAVVRSTTDSLEAGRTWYFEVKGAYPNAVSSTLERLGGF
jgi:hypothetical protein